MKSLKVLKWLMKRLLGVLIIQSLTFYFYINVFGLHTYSKEKVFIKDGKEVILLGMYHIGSFDYYKKIKNRYKLKKDLIVLSEGVRSKGEIDIDHIYSAGIFGLDIQQKNLFENYKEVNSDVEISNIDPKAIDFLENVFLVWKNMALLDFSKAKSKIKILKNEYKKENVSLSYLYNEIVIKRNVKIKENILKYKDKNLLIPWGALHHEDLEDFLLENGYKVKETSYIRNFNFVEALFFLTNHFWRY